MDRRLLYALVVSGIAVVLVGYLLAGRKSRETTGSIQTLSTQSSVFSEDEAARHQQALDPESLFQVLSTSESATIPTAAAPVVSSTSAIVAEDIIIPPAINPTYETEETDVWSYLPHLQGAFGVPQLNPTEDEATRALRNYGNEVGDIINQYAQLAPEHTRLANAFFIDRSGKEAHMQRIADDYMRTRDALATIDPLPTSASLVHQGLLDGYASLAEGHRLLGKSRTDKEVLAAVTDYNTRAQTFTSALLSFCELFTLNRITFTEGEGAAELCTFSQKLQ